MSVPGEILPESLGLMPTLEQVAAAPPKRDPRSTRRHLRKLGIPTRNNDGYPKERQGTTAYIFRSEWETARPLHTRSVTNRLREARHSETHA